MGNEFTTIALVRKTQGRRGEIAAELYTDFPERFEERRKIFQLADNGQRCELELESFWFHQGRIILKFAGIDSLSDAERLIGCELQIPTSQRAVLEPGSVYISDLVGSTVYHADQRVGQIKRVVFGAGEAPLLVVSAEPSKNVADSEYLIPFAQAYLRTVDIKGKQIRMLLPEGILDVNVASETVLNRHRSRRALGRRAKPI